MFNNVNRSGLFKSREVDVLKIPGATSSYIIDKIDDVLEGKPESSIVHVQMNDNVNLLNNLLNSKRPLPILCSVSHILFLEEINFCNQKNINLIINNNKKEEHLGIKKLHLHRKGNSVFVKHLLNFIEGN